MDILENLKMEISTDHKFATKMSFVQLTLLTVN